MNTKEIEGSVKIFDYEILDGARNILDDLVASEINNSEPAWTGEIYEWKLELPHEIDVPFTATIGVDEEED